MVRLVWHKHRWRCQERACPRGSFTESIRQVPPRARITARLRHEVGAAAADRFSCVLAAATHYRVSWPVAHRALAGHIAGPLPAVTVLGIDGTRRGKPVWAQDPVTKRWRVAHDRWHTGIVDAVGTAGLLAHVEGRTSTAVISWLEAQPQAWRDAVTHVTIDPAWTNRRRLLTGFDRLSPEAFTRMWNGLTDIGDPQDRDPARLDRQGGPARPAGLVRHGPQPGRGRPPARPVLPPGGVLSAPDAHRLAETIEAWWPAIEAANTTGYSNARSEGYNRLAKHVGRNAFGFRNVDNQRQRIRWACTRQHRRASVKNTQLPAHV